MNIEEKNQLIAIWSKAVDTQMHFNEMSVKSRQLGLTFVAAALGVGVVLIGNGQDFSLDFKGVHFHVSVFLMIGSILALQAVRQLDLGVYHKMLRGAVYFGEDFEQNYLKSVFDLEKGMTQAISHFSRHEDAKVEKGENGKFTYAGENEKNALKKIVAFYCNTTAFLCVATLVLFVFTNPQWFETGAHQVEITADDNKSETDGENK